MVEPQRPAASRYIELADSSCLDPRLNCLSPDWVGFGCALFVLFVCKWEFLNFPGAGRLELRTWAVHLQDTPLGSAQGP